MRKESDLKKNIFLAIDFYPMDFFKKAKDRILIYLISTIYMKKS